MNILMPVVLTSMLTTPVLAFETGFSDESLQVRFTRIFQDIDINHDEVLSLQEISSTGLSEESFHNMDVDGDSLVTLTEFLVITQS